NRIEFKYTLSAVNLSNIFLPSYHFVDFGKGIAYLLLMSPQFYSSICISRYYLFVINPFNCCDKCFPRFPQCFHISRIFVQTRQTARYFKLHTSHPLKTAHRPYHTANRLVHSFPRPGVLSSQVLQIQISPPAFLDSSLSGPVCPHRQNTS